MSALNRWTAQKRDLEMANTGKSSFMGGALPDSATYGPYAAKKRPKIASEINTVKECEHWRTQILRGCAKKIAEIQNASLGEHRIRDLNDEINKDLREKSYWEDQIKALGGTDYKAGKGATAETYGAELAAHSGYKYFGAAKDLPGVRELFDTEAVPEAPRKTRKQLFKNIQPDYYGWRDEEDGMLILAEGQAEFEARQKEVARWKVEEANRPAPAKKQKTGKEGAKEEAKKPEEEAKAPEKTEAQAVNEFKSYVDVPSMDEIEKLIIQKKKQALLNKYTTAEQKAKDKEVEGLVGGNVLPASAA